MTPEELLDLPLPGRPLGAGTVRGYLVSLLTSLWRDGGVFPARQIFGPDGWRSELHGPMVVAGAVPGTVDESGRPDIGYQAEREADALILAAIDLLGRKGSPPSATELADGATVIVEGRPYYLDPGAPNCVSLRHRHSEPHANGTKGDEAHHHHSERCQDLPRQATLYPLWETILRHDHAFGAPADGVETCGCGAQREELPGSRLDPGQRLMTYHNPPDDCHPAGWTYRRKEDAGRDI